MNSFWNLIFGRKARKGQITRIDAGAAPAMELPTVSAAPAQNIAVRSTDSPLPKASQVQQARIFEPALRHLPNAFAPAIPEFPDDQTRSRWLEARINAMHHVLSLVSQSPWSQHLMLRGSLLMKLWLSDQARPPGDIDWVVTPETIKLTDRFAGELFSGIRSLIHHNPVYDDISFHSAQAKGDDIWSYERAPGRRIVIPCTVNGLPPFTVQMDFVFAENLPIAPVDTAITLQNGQVITIRAATPELSLLWKLLWLETDSYPQGKDLYDAVLLAEFTPFKIAMLERILARDNNLPNGGLPRDFALKWHIDWDNFLIEYPHVSGTPGQWKARLQQALDRNLFT